MSVEPPLFFTVNVCGGGFVPGRARTIILGGYSSITGCAITVRLTVIVCGEFIAPGAVTVIVAV